jgi:pimeloyl-ACP methyl ester carboxylesterase
MSHTKSPAPEQQPSWSENRAVLETRLGPIGYQTRGDGERSIVFVAGALANGDLWTDVVAEFNDRYRCIMLDLPLGAHRWPLAHDADRSARSLARLILDCLDALEVHDVVLVANDTAGGLCLLALDEAHDGMSRIDSLVLTNCDCFDHFPPRSLRPFSAMCRRAPRLTRRLVRRMLQTERGRRRMVASLTNARLDDEQSKSFFAPSHNPAIVDDLVRAFAGFRPSIMLAAEPAITRFARPVVLAWGDKCKFFPLHLAEHLAATFPNASLEPIRGASTWVPLDAPSELAAIIDDAASRDQPQPCEDER